MPTVEVPRVVRETHGGAEYKIDERADGRRVLFVRQREITGGMWKDICSAAHTIDMDRLGLIVDLFASPTITRPADEVDP